MERIGEVNKVVSFFHRDVNVLQRKDFIKKSLTDQKLEMLAVNSRFLGLLTPLWPMRGLDDSLRAAVPFPLSSMKTTIIC